MNNRNAYINGLRSVIQSHGLLNDTGFHLIRDAYITTHRKLRKLKKK